MVQDTMREISFLSQRQVIQPNPPVRSDVAITEPSRSEKGQWNWSSLTKKPSGLKSTDELHQKILEKIAVSAEIPPIECFPASINQSTENSKRSKLSSELKPSQTDALALLNQELERDDW
uniref:AlNc14C2587G13262 protein n=1 Tax=Albugo laibachii Nc14 TaxID=890382 RepID=F0X2Y8_9STRA|nr:AlNc14C2587G13262 [Albugo laibachii Nc14]|eukprot:CCA28361.1 AlNc14C2587G13262 [Albugo laibachii Nc14]